MQNLTRASRELFARSPDERFETLPDLVRHCRQQRSASADRWLLPDAVRAERDEDGLGVRLGAEAGFRLNDWSFSQLCRLAGVAKETVNRLSPATAAKVLEETLPAGKKPLQVFAQENRVRSIHAASYTRLFHAELLDVVQEYAVDFQPPQKGLNGATGLYCGEQDLFAFLIVPTGWVEMEPVGAFAPGFFVFNSEVGRRSVGIQTFWFQAVCANHIVWDAVEVVDFSRKHTANVGEALVDVRRIIEGLVAKRDARRDGFAQVIRKAAQERLAAPLDGLADVIERWCGGFAQHHAEFVRASTSALLHAFKAGKYAKLIKQAVPHGFFRGVCGQWLIAVRTLPTKAANTNTAQAINVPGSGTASIPCMVKLAVGVLNISCSGNAVGSAASANGRMPVTSNDETPLPGKVNVWPGKNDPRTVPPAETVNGASNPVGNPVIPVNSESGVVIS